MDSRIVNVIVTTEGEMQRYFTLQGLLIGTLKGGHLLRPEADLSEHQEENSKKKTAGGVVKPLSPVQLKRKKRKESERALTLEERLKYEKEENT